MPEIEPPSAHGDEACLLRKVEPARAGAERFARPGNEPCVLQVVGRGDQQDALSLVRKPPDLLEEDALDARRERQRLRERLVAGQLTFAERRRELHEREGVPLRLFDQALADRRGRRACDPGEQGRRRFRVEPFDEQRRQVFCLESADIALARRKQHHDALGVEAARDEQQRLGRDLVEPVRVVHEAEHGTAIRHLGEEREARGVDEEALFSAPAPEAQRAAECRRLRAGQPVEMAQRRPHELVERGERKLRLELDTSRGEDVHVAGSVACVPEERGLADSWLAVHDEHAARRVASRLEQPSDLGPLGVTPVEHAGSVKHEAAFGKFAPNDHRPFHRCDRAGRLLP